MSRAWWERPLPGADAFAGLCADVGDVVRCGPSGDEAGGGRGLFATAAVAKGETIFRESPAVLVQDPRNRAETRACGCCHAMLAEESPSVAQPSCAWGCGERYCDETCKEKHVRRLGHRVFCVGPLDSWDHPIAALRLEAARDDDQDGLLAFVQEMAARVLHETNAEMERRGTDERTADDEEDEDAVVAAAVEKASLAWFVKGGESKTSPLAPSSPRCLTMASLVANASKAAIDDRENDRFITHVTCGNQNRLSSTDGDATEDTKKKEKRRRRLRAAAALLFDARGVSALATLATRNQLSVVVVRRDLFKTQETKTYDGLGVFPLTCLMNHSCAPNAETLFDDGFDDEAVRVSSTAEASAPRARVVALRDVAAGEELTHAYVDVTRPAEVRAAALAGFGFKCGCERCARARGG